MFPIENKHTVFNQSIKVFFFETGGQPGQRQRIKLQEKHAHHRGEAEPLGRDTPPSKETKTKPHHGQPSKPTKVLSVRSYSHTNGNPQ